MGSDRRSNGDRTAGDASGRRRYTVAAAAQALGISPEAVRTRISRGKLDHEKHGSRVFVLLEPDQTRPNTDQTNDQTALVDALQGQVGFLQAELERRAGETAELRRIIAALTSRIPEIEAPQEERESTVSRGPTRTPTDAGGEPQEGTERPWWRRMFGG